ncbi:MAG: hypothetical protein ISR80_05135 [Nitrosopumilus sp.]|nr:hypothetical protein [Nitrosopumilus sp.]
MMANILKEPTGNFNPTRPLTRDIEIIEKLKERWFQCTHCDAESQSFKAFEFCKQKRHEVITVYRPAELSQKQIEEQKIFKNDDHDLVAELIKKEKHFLTLRETDDIWYYNDEEGIYKPYGNTIIEDQCQRLIHRCKNQATREVIGTIKRDNTRIDSSELFDSKIICALDGILESDFTIKSHSPEYMVYSKLPFNLKPKYVNLKLWNHILTIIDVRDINLIMELIWICVSWTNPFKKMFIFKGIQDTQKTALANIITWIIGKKNVSTQKPETFLEKGSRFATSHFIGKRMNIAGEIGNFTEQWLENQKALVGGEEQNTETKFSNAERIFNPEHFVFLYTTNSLGEIYSKINDNSVITRFQFIIFRNQLLESKKNGQWFNSFFKDDEDKQTAIDTLVMIIINYIKVQQLGKIPKTKWSNIEDTKKILHEQMPIEDKYFAEKRIFYKPGSKISFAEIKEDFESYIKKDIKPQELGIILKKNGLKSNSSSGVVYYKEYTLKKKESKGDKAVNDY